MCIENDTNNQHYGCRYHRANAQLWSQGNPHSCEQLRLYMKEYSERMAAYKATGDTALLPNQLLAIMLKET
jgi:hypothetical protein